MRSLSTLKEDTSRDLRFQETPMLDGEMTYKGFGIQPLAAYDEGRYAAMVIVRSPDGYQRASDVLGSFADPTEAKQHALRQGMSEVDRRTAHEEAALRK